MDVFEDRRSMPRSARQTGARLVQILGPWKSLESVTYRPHRYETKLFCIVVSAVTLVDWGGAKARYPC